MAMAISDTVAPRPHFMARNPRARPCCSGAFWRRRSLIFLLYRILPLGWNVLLSFRVIGRR